MPAEEYDAIASNVAVRSAIGCLLPQRGFSLLYCRAVPYRDYTQSVQTSSFNTSV